MSIEEMQNSIKVIKALYQVDKDEAHRELDHLLWRFVGLASAGYSNIQDLAMVLNGIEGEFPFIAK